MNIGFVNTKGKTQNQVKQELEQRFGSLSKKDVKVLFYDVNDVNKDKIDVDMLSKLLTDGFAVTKDGTVWINKSHVDSGKVIDFNKTTQHEIGHIVFGEDSEYEAQYLEMAYGKFLQEIADNGYLSDSEGIIDYSYSTLTKEDLAKLNSYVVEEMEFRELSGDETVDRRGIPLDASKQSPVEFARNTMLIQKHLELEKKKKTAKKNVSARARKEIAESKSYISEEEMERAINIAIEEAYSGELKKLLTEEIELRKKGVVQKENRILKFLAENKFGQALRYFGYAVNERERVLISYDVQKKSHKDKWGYSPSESYMADRIVKYMNNIEINPSSIATAMPGGVVLSLIQEDIYSNKFWIGEVDGKGNVIKSFNVGDKYGVEYYDYTTNSKKVYHLLVVDKTDDRKTGFQMATFYDPKTKELVTVGEGSDPAIHEVNKDLSGWYKDWMVNNFIGNIDPKTYSGRIDYAVPIKERISNDVPYTPNQSILSEHYIREIESRIKEGKIEVKGKKYDVQNSIVSLNLGHSLAGAFQTYGSHRTGRASIAVDPAPNNMPVRNRNHLALIPKNAILNKTEIRNGILQHYTSIYGISPSVYISELNQRVGLVGLGATGNPAFQSASYKIEYNEKTQKYEKDTHKLNLEKFEYDILDELLLVRPDKGGR